MLEQKDLEDDLYKEASTLYEYVRSHLKVGEDGEVDLPKEFCPQDFDWLYSRGIIRRDFDLKSDEMDFTATLSNEEADDKLDKSVVPNWVGSIFYPCLKPQS